MKVFSGAGRPVANGNYEVLPYRTAQPRAPAAYGPPPQSRSVFAPVAHRYSFVQPPRTLAAALSPTANAQTHRRKPSYVPQPIPSAAVEQKDGEYLHRLTKNRRNDSLEALVSMFGSWPVDRPQPSERGAELSLLESLLHDLRLQLPVRYGLTLAEEPTAPPNGRWNDFNPHRPFSAAFFAQFSQLTLWLEAVVVGDASLCEKPHDALVAALLAGIECDHHRFLPTNC